VFCIAFGLALLEDFPLSTLFFSSVLSHFPTSFALDKNKKKGAVDNPVTMKSDTKNQGTWLSMSLEAALGCRANVFQVHKTGKKHSSNTSGTVTIHPQAAPVVCRHALDTAPFFLFLSILLLFSSSS
jgi:hypothetical protein